MAGLRANIYDNVNDTYIWLRVPIFVIQVPSQMQAGRTSAVKYVVVCLCGQLQKGAN